MTELFFRFFSISVTVCTLSLLVLLFFGAFGKRFSAKCRYFVWSILLLRLLVPVGGFGTPIFNVTIPPEERPAITQSETVTETLVHVENTVTSEEKTPEAIPPVIGEVGTLESGFVPPTFEQTETLPSQSVPTLDVQTDTPPVYVPEIPEADPVPDVEEDSVKGESAVKPAPQSSVVTLRDPESSVNNSAPVKVDSGKNTITLRGILDIIAAVWLLGAAVLLAVKLGAYISYSCALRRYGTLAEPTDKVREIYAKAVSDLDLKRAPKIRVNSDADSPMLVGFFNPTVILSEVSATDEGLYRIITHELTHYRRGDLWIKLLCAVAESVYWFNPFVRIITAKCVGEMELSCDEATLAGLCDEDRISYGEAVLAIVKNGKKKSRSSLTTSFSAGGNSVKKRFEGIIDGSRKRKGTAVVATVLVLCMISGSLIVFSDENMEKEAERNDETDVKTEEENTSDNDSTGKNDDVPEKPPLVIPTFELKTADCQGVFLDKPDISDYDYKVTFSDWNLAYKVTLCTVRQCTDGCSADAVVNNAARDKDNGVEIRLIGEMSEDSGIFYGTKVYGYVPAEAIPQSYTKGNSAKRSDIALRSTVYLIPIGDSKYLTVRISPSEDSERDDGEREAMNALMAGVRLEKSDGIVIEPSNDCIHEYAELSRVDANCTDDGSVSYRCKNCKGEKTEILTSAGHLSPAPTCTTHSVCTVCGETTASAAGHDFAPATTVVPKTCKVCGVTEGWPAIEIDTSDALGEHQFSAIRLFFCSDNTRPRWQYYKYIARTVRLTVNDIGYTVGEPDENGFYPVTFYGKTEKTYDDRDGLDISFTSKIYTKKQVEKEATGVNDFIPTMDFGTEVDMDTPDGTFVSATKYLPGGYYTVEIKDNPPQMYPPVDYEPLESLSIDLESFKKNTSDDIKFTDVPPKSEDLSVCIKEYRDPDTNAFRGDEIMSAVRIDNVSYTVDDFDSFERYVVTLTFSGEVIYDNTDDDTAYVKIVVINDKKGIGYVRNIPYSNFAAGSRVKGSVTLPLDGADYRVYFENGEVWEYI